MVCITQCQIIGTEKPLVGAASEAVIDGGGISYNMMLNGKTQMPAAAELSVAPEPARR